MRFVYQISLLLYSLFLRIASLFNSKAKAWVSGRKDLKWKKVDFSDKSVIWFHCASLGEFDIALPLMQAWKDNYPGDFIILTFFSPSGMQNYHKRNHPADLVDYISLDTPSHAKAFIQKIQPKTVIFVKYEFWAFHLFEARKAGAKIYSVNTLFRDNQMYFKWYGDFYRKILKTFDHFFVQNDNSIRLLKKIGITNATVSGDLRFDRVFQNKQKAQANPILHNWLGNEKALIIGSSWSVDEKILLPFINQKIRKKKVILAPHEVNESHIREIEKSLQVPHIRFTDMMNGEVIKQDIQVVILNTIGHLTNAYQYGDVAYIGGGFTGKLHNILEPAVFGLPILIGPKHDKFPEGKLFIEKGFCFEICDASDINNRYFAIQENLPEIKEKMLRYMEKQVGISFLIMKHIHQN
jgi:3-deoxy-D-manno-octulosonic-acid transferase